MTQPLGGQRIAVARTAAGVRFGVRVIPRARRPSVGGSREGHLVVRVSAAPVDGAANTAVVRAIAEVLGVARSRVLIASGNTSPRKVIDVATTDAATVQSRLEALGGEPTTS